jgi:hypothetical protein
MHGYVKGYTQNSHGQFIRKTAKNRNNTTRHTSPEALEIWHIFVTSVFLLCPLPFGETGAATATCSGRQHRSGERLEVWLLELVRRLWCRPSGGDTGVRSVYPHCLVYNQLMANLGFFTLEKSRLGAKIPPKTKSSCAATLLHNTDYLPHWPYA